jgi:hypothetical protein
MYPGQYPAQRSPVPPRPPYRQPSPYPFQQVQTPQRVRWVASPPPGVWPLRRVATPERYTGPPSYPAVPRWGFPNLTWRSPTAVPGTASDELTPLQRLRVLSRSTVLSLWAFAVLALIAGGAETWRYVLLVQSRDSALSAGVVHVSDTLVVTAGLLVTILAVIPVGLGVWWLFVARLAAADESGAEPARPPRQVALGTLVPGLNLFMAGSIMAELEHAVLRRPPTRRPAPSRLVLSWWAAWVLNWLLLAVVICWRLRTGVQAQADSVVLIALSDLSAAGLAVMTALVVRRMTGLLAPTNEHKLRPMRVLKVNGAPEPELRKARASGSAR